MLLIAGLVVAFSGDKDKGPLNAEGDGPTTTAPSDVGFVVPTLPGDPAPPSTTTTIRRPTTGGTVGSGSNGTAAPTTSTSVRATDIESKERKCVNTTAVSAPEPVPDDWADYWTTKPDPNWPIEMAICVDDATPKVGQRVTLGLLARDRDMKITTGQCDVRVTWEGPPRDCRQEIIAQPKSDPGPHQVDDKTRNQITLEFSRTFDESGERTISVSVWSGPDDGKRYAYANYNSLEMTINVHK